MRPAHLTLLLIACVSLDTFKLSVSQFSLVKNKRIVLLQTDKHKWLQKSLFRIWPGFSFPLTGTCGSREGKGTPSTPRCREAVMRNQLLH